MAGGQAYQPEGIDALVARMNDQQSQLDALRAALGAGLHVEGATGDLVVDDGRTVRTGDFNGDNVSTPGTAGWSLAANGNASFNNLILAGGIIGNDALTNPVKGTVLHADRVNFALTTTYSVLLNASVTVPDGFTSAFLFIVATGNARNKSAFQDYFSLGVGLASASIPGVISNGDGAPGYSIGLANGGSIALTGLTGGQVITAQAKGNSGLGNWSADTFNALNLDGWVMYFR